jgi:polyisoprenoid-binding protein YceI
MDDAADTDDGFTALDATPDSFHPCTRTNPFSLFSCNTRGPRFVWVGCGCERAHWLETAELMGIMMRSELSREAGRRWLIFALLPFLLATLGVSSSLAQNNRSALTNRSPTIAVRLEPAKTTIHWMLPSTLHTVHGTFSLKWGELRLNPETGKAEGEIVVDATSGQSGNSSRDSKMHREVLQSAKYPEISFRASAFTGKLPKEGQANMQVQGTLTLHGADHPLTLPITAELSGNHWKATCAFSVPYVNWGLKNPSNFLLKVKKEVQIEIESSGTINSENPQ